jgi:hypothetical protein
MDHAWHQDGLRLPWSRIALGLSDWSAKADRCDTVVILAAGGSEPLLRADGAYELNERHADVLPRLDAAGDGRLRLRGDGAIVLDLGDVPPEDLVRLDDSSIISYSKLRRGLEKLKRRNLIRATYTRADDNNYREQQALAWRDEASIAAYGEQDQLLDLTWVTSHRQVRMLMKRAAYRFNPTWSGDLINKATGLNALGERFVNAAVDDLDIDLTFEKQGMSFVSDTGVSTLSVIAMPSEAFVLDISEQGTPPVADSVGDDTAVTNPTGLTVSGRAVHP